MAKRSKAKRKSVNVRVSNGTKELTTKLAKVTEWSETEALTFVADAGARALYSPDGAAAVAGVRAVLAAAIETAEARRAAGRTVELAAGQLRQARKALDSTAPTPTELGRPPEQRQRRNAAGGAPSTTKRRASHPKSGSGERTGAPQGDDSGSGRPNTPPGS
jgi:hypothetical protein